MHTLIDGKQQLVIRYKDFFNRYKIGFMTFADIYRAFTNTSIGEFCVLNKDMQWTKVTSFTRSDLPPSTTGFEVATDHQSSVTAMPSQRMGVVTNVFKPDQAYSVTSIGGIHAGTNIRAQNTFLIYDSSFNNQADVAQGQFRTPSNPSRLGYLDGMVLAGFILLGGVCHPDGTVSMEYPSEYNAKNRNFTSDRKSQILNAVRECLRLYDPYGLLTFKFETDNMTGHNKLQFTSRRIAEMILRYVVSEAEAFGISSPARDANDPQWYHERNLWLCLAHSKIVNPNRYYDNDPIIRNTVDVAEQRVRSRMPAAGEGYVENQTNNPADDTIFTQVTISPDVLLESYDFRKGILNGLFDCGPLTLHTSLPTKGLVDITRLVAVSVGLNIYEKRDPELDHDQLKYYDVSMDWTSRPNNVVVYRDPVQISTDEDTPYVYDIGIENDGLITLPNGLMPLAKAEPVIA